MPSFEKVPNAPGLWLRYSEFSGRAAFTGQCEKIVLSDIGPVFERATDSEVKEWEGCYWYGPLPTQMPAMEESA